MCQGCIEIKLEQREELILVKAHLVSTYFVALLNWIRQINLEKVIEVRGQAARKVSYS
jgi:hypothetical protein